MDFPGGAIKALQQDPRVWEHLGRIATAGEAGWERHFRHQVAVSLTNLGFPTETEIADSPAVLAEESQALPSEEGLPTGFAHGASPSGLAHRVHPQGSPSADKVARRERRRRAREWTESDDPPAVRVGAAPAGIPGATTPEATHSFLAGDWARHFLATLEADRPGARRTFEQAFRVAPGTSIKEARERMRGLRHRLTDSGQPRNPSTPPDPLEHLP